MAGMTLLCTRLAPEVERRGVHTLVDHSLEEADVGPKRLVIERGVHFFGDPPERLNLGPEGVRQLRNGGVEHCVVLVGQCIVRLANRIEGRPGQGLDLDVHQDEPVLVIKVHEVLDRVDIPQGDRPRWIEPLPVEEGIAIVTEDGRPPQSIANVAERNGQVARQHGGGILPHLVHIPRGQETKTHVIESQQLDGDSCGRQRGDFQGPRTRPETFIVQQAWKVPTDRVERCEGRARGELGRRVGLGKQPAASELLAEHDADP